MSANPALGKTAVSLGLTWAKVRPCLKSSNSNEKKLLITKRLKRILDRSLLSLPSNQPFVSHEYS